jgi:hypothetical protein
MIKSRAGKRHAADLYPTPSPVCTASVTKLADLGINPHFILDVGAGDGVWGKAARSQWSGAEVSGVEVRDLPQPAAYDIWHISRFEDMKPGCYDLILGNPPFKSADQFIHHGLRQLLPGGYLVFLLGIQFLGGKARRNDLWSQTPLKRVIVGSDRISFTGENPTHQHALYVWQNGYMGQPALDWIVWGDNSSRVYDERELQMSLWEE